MPQPHSAFPHDVSEWAAEGMELITVEDYARMGLEGTRRDAQGTGYPVRDGYANFDYLCLLSDPKSIPVDASHILWVPL